MRDVGKEVARLVGALDALSKPTSQQTQAEQQEAVTAGLAVAVGLLTDIASIADSMRRIAVAADNIDRHGVGTKAYGGTGGLGGKQ